MSDFIRVLGDDPHYRGRKAYMYVHRSFICKVYPDHAEIKDNKAWRCHDDNPKSQIVSYTLVDTQGNQYSCGKKEELQKLGLNLEAKPGRIGFVSDTAVDLPESDAEEGN